MVTGRRCHLIRLRTKPARPIVTQVKEWMIRELKADVDAVSALYPSLNIGCVGSDTIN
jgi:LysR family transcriptional regulator, glycine cleavage system transcriptional activator